jgi:hypothetical protein
MLTRGLFDALGFAVGVLWFSLRQMSLWSLRLAGHFSIQQKCVRFAEDGKVNQKSILSFEKSKYVTAEQRMI